MRAWSLARGEKGKKLFGGKLPGHPIYDIMSSLKEAQQLEGGRGGDPLWIGSPSTDKFLEITTETKTNKIQERHGMEKKIKWKTKVVKWDNQNVISTVLNILVHRGKQKPGETLTSEIIQRTFTFCIHVCSLIISVTGEKKSLGRTYASRFAWKPKTC